MFVSILEKRIHPINTIVKHCISSINCRNRLIFAAIIVISKNAQKFNLESVLTCCTGYESPRAAQSHSAVPVRYVYQMYMALYTGRPQI